MFGRKIIGPDLRALRVEADVSCAELARRCNRSEGAVRNVENGNQQPSGRFAVRLARELSALLKRSVRLDDFSREIAEEDLAA